MSSETVMEHAAQPYHLGGAAGMPVVGREGAPGEGPYMTVGLRLESGLIAEARFETYGCPSAIACGSWMTRWMEGRQPESTLVLEAGDLVKLLGLPLGKEHVAVLAVKALNLAVGEWRRRR